MLKGRASRRLTRFGVDPTCRRWWTRGGSTKYLWREEDVDSAIEYVVERQGEKMAVYDGRVDSHLRPGPWAKAHGSD